LDIKSQFLNLSPDTKIILSVYPVMEHLERGDLSGHYKEQITFEEKQMKGGIKQGFFKIQDVKDPISLEEYL